MIRFAIEVMVIFLFYKLVIVAYFSGWTAFILGIISFFIAEVISRQIFKK